MIFHPEPRRHPDSTPAVVPPRTPTPYIGYIGLGVTGCEGEQAASIATAHVPKPMPHLGSPDKGTT